MNFALPQFKLAFILIPKVGSSTCMEKMGWMLGVPDIDGEDQNIKRKRVSDAIPCQGLAPVQLMELRDKGWEIVSFVRDPGRRAFSCWTDKIMPDPFDCPGYTDGVENSFLPYGDLFWPKMEFLPFVKSICAIPDHQSDHHFASQSAFLKGGGGALIPTRLWPLGDMAQAWSWIASLLIMPQIMEPAHLHRRGDGFKGLRFSDHFTEEIEALLRVRYAEDYEVLMEMGKDALQV